MPGQADGKDVSLLCKDFCARSAICVGSHSASGTEEEKEKQKLKKKICLCFRNLLVQQVTETLDTGEEVITRDVTANPKIFA